MNTALKVFFNSLKTVNMKGSKWTKFKKGLPKNWRQEVSKSLNERGVNLSEIQIGLIRSGNIVNIEYQKIVWNEIKLLRDKIKKDKDQIKAVQNA